MPAGGTVSIDIADHAPSVTASVKALLGDHVKIGPEDVAILANGWLRVTRGRDHLYISPHAVASVLIQDGELALE